MTVERLVAALAAAPAAWVVVGLVVAALVAEDVACVSAGVLVGAGGIDPWAGVLGCFAGVLAGDLGAWAAGRYGRRWAAPRPAADPAWVPAALLAARFVPGTRVPVHVGVGLAGAPAVRVAAWAAVAAAVWAPLVVLGVALFGTAATGRLGAGAAVVAAVLFGVRVGALLADPTRRRRVAAAVSRVWRWEFWPAWVFYLPLAPWYLALAARHRGLTVWTAANPGIPAGGVVGESKADILRQLDPRFVAPTLLVPPGEHADRVALAVGWDFPLILKPDAGQRGAGVRKAHDRADVEKYLAANPGAVVAQPYHPGPFEAGVFYYRFPGEGRGHVFSVTDKEFPAVVGDGRSTLAELVWAHPRYRMQAGVFLARHAGAADVVIPAGERFPLATAGNHCQGTLFRDGAHLATPELARALDEVVRPFPGFCFGRFDLRYADAAELRAGRGFAVIELNGATSESTNLYDPSWPLWRAYLTLFRQWALAFHIGALNRERGHRPVGAVELSRLVRVYYRDRVVSPLSD